MCNWESIFIKDLSQCPLSMISHKWLSKMRFSLFVDEINFQPESYTFSNFGIEVNDTFYDTTNKLLRSFLLFLVVSLH